MDPFLKIIIMHVMQF